MNRTASITLTILFAILGSGVLATAAHAQFDPEITVNIPFPFSADGREIAAGTYQLQPLSSNFLMSVRNVRTGAEQVINVLPHDARTVAERGSLVFQTCGDRRYLTEIHIPAAELFSETIKGRTHHPVGMGACPNSELTTLALPWRYADAQAGGPKRADALSRKWAALRPARQRSRQRARPLIVRRKPQQPH